MVLHRPAAPLSLDAEGRACQCPGCLERYHAIEVMCLGFFLAFGSIGEHSRHHDTEQTRDRWRAAWWWGSFRRMWWGIADDIDPDGTVASGLRRPRTYTVTLPQIRIGAGERTQVSWRPEESQRWLADIIRNARAIRLMHVRTGGAESRIERLVVDDLIEAQGGNWHELRLDLRHIIVRSFVAIALWNPSAWGADNASCEIAIAVIPQARNPLVWRRRTWGDRCTCLADHEEPTPKCAPLTWIAEEMRRQSALAGDD